MMQVELKGEVRIDLGDGPNTTAGRPQSFVLNDVFSSATYIPCGYIIYGHLQTPQEMILRGG